MCGSGLPWTVPASGSGSGAGTPPPGCAASSEVGHSPVSATQLPGKKENTGIAYLFLCSGEKRKQRHCLFILM